MTERECFRKKLEAEDMMFKALKNRIKLGENWFVDGWCPLYEVCEDMEFRYIVVVSNHNGRHHYYYFYYNAKNKEYKLIRLTRERLLDLVIMLHGAYQSLAIDAMEKLSISKVREPIREILQKFEHGGSPIWFAGSCVC